MLNWLHCGLLRLLVREQKYLGWQTERLETKLGRLSERTNLERVGFRGSVRCLSVRGCFTLWEEYVAQAEETLASIGNYRFIVKYEDFLMAPAVYLSEMVRFCRLGRVSSQVIQDVAKAVKRERARAFLTDPVLRSFSHEANASPWMWHYGYAEAPTPSELGHPAGSLAIQ